MKRRPSTERGDLRREQILREALTLFAEQGIEGTGLRQIAAQVGIAQPALYYYFASKAELVDAIIEWRAAVAAERFESVAHPGRRKSLRQGLIDYLELLHGSFTDPDNVAIHRVMLAEFAQGSPIATKLRRTFIAPQLKRLETLFVSLIAAGKVRDLAPDVLALQFMGPLLFAAFSMEGIEQGRLSMQQLIFQHLEVFIRGVEAR